MVCHEKIQHRKDFIEVVETLRSNSITVGLEHFF